MGEKQKSSDLDQALISAIISKRHDHCRLLLEADADVQAGLHACVRDALSSGHRGHASGAAPSKPPTKQQSNILRLLVDSGATVGDKEMQYLDDAIKSKSQHSGESNASQE